MDTAEDQSFPYDVGSDHLSRDAPSQFGQRTGFAHGTDLAVLMQAGGGPPKPDQVAEMERLQAKPARSGEWGTILAAVALLSMAVASYL